MGIMDSPPPTTRTRIHKRLTAALEAMGFDVEEEVSFPPYIVDCYIRNLHVALEADGPTHVAEKDAKRDTVLLATYALPVIHLSQAALTGKENHVFKMIARAALQGSWITSVANRTTFAKRMMGGEI